MTLAHIYAQHIRSQAEEQKERDQYRLYVTDVGRCPREVGYRLLGCEKDEKSQSAIDNDAIMFDLADYMEQMLTDALIDHEDYVWSQGPVELYDRVNWGGRYDIVADYHGCRVIEVKTVRPNAFNYEMPKKPHTYQAAIYQHYLAEEFVFEAPPLIVYFDRGGTNTPVECEVDISTDEWVPLMDELDAMRLVISKDGGPIPDPLPRTLKLRSYGKKILEEPDHRCLYCDYAGTCQPNLSKNLWAERDKQLWRLSRNADMEKLLSFVKDNIEGTFTVGDARFGEDF